MSRCGRLGADHLTFEGGGGGVIYGQQDFFSSNLVGRIFFTAVQEFFSITFVLHAIFFFRQALAGMFFFFFKITHPLPQELNGRPLTGGGRVPEVRPQGAKV